MPMYVRMVKEVEFASSCFVFTEAAAADLENWSQNGGKRILLAMACFSNQCASTEPLMCCRGCKCLLSSG